MSVTAVVFQTQHTGFKIMNLNDDVSSSIQTYPLPDNILFSENLYFLINPGTLDFIVVNL